MDLGRFLIETHLRTRRPIAELASSHDVHRSWLYKLLKRYRLEGPSGLEPRSRRPLRSPSRKRHQYEDEIVTLRKDLLDLGVDAGAETIRYHLQKTHTEVVPSVSTVWRVLKARGFVTPQPQKRPKSSYKRFCADLPNETWQADVTHVTLANGLVFEVLNIIDDHSRLCVASRAFVTTKSSDVVRTFYKAAETLGFPQSFLTDNGLIFTSQARHGFAGAFEMELAGLGIHSKHSRPYHPQTSQRWRGFTRPRRSTSSSKMGSRRRNSSKPTSIASPSTTTSSVRTALSEGGPPKRCMRRGRRLVLRQSRST